MVNSYKGVRLPLSCMEIALRRRRDQTIRVVAPLSLHSHKATGRVGRTSGASAFVPLVVERLVGSLAADWLVRHSTAPCLPRLVVTLTEDII